MSNETNRCVCAPGRSGWSVCGIPCPVHPQPDLQDKEESKQACHPLPCGRCSCNVYELGRALAVALTELRIDRGVFEAHGLAAWSRREQAMENHCHEQMTRVAAALQQIEGCGMSEKESSCCKLPCGHCSCNAQVTPGWPCEICELEETVRQFEAQAQTAIELLSERNRELAELKQPAVVPKLKVGDEVYGIELTGRGGNTVIGPMLVVESKTLLRAKTKTGRTAFALIDEDAFATREEAEAECSRRNEEAGNEGD